MAAADITANTWPNNSGVAQMHDHPNGTKHDGKHIPHDSALSVGVVDESSVVVRELQEEVRELTEKVAGASQRFADYENEIRVLQAQLRQEKRRNASNPTTNTNDQSATQPPQPPGLSRFGSFMSTRKASSPIATPNRERERELEAAVAQEQIQRLAAEKKVTEVTNEIEELSASLFQQANDMVSTERRENAALQERIALLEERDTKLSMRLQALDQRDIDRKRRMDRLDAAMKRIERAKALLVPR